VRDSIRQVLSSPLPLSKLLAKGRAIACSLDDTPRQRQRQRIVKYLNY
jgi:hypothetical protein